MERFAGRCVRPACVNGSCTLKQRPKWRLASRQGAAANKLSTRQLGSTQGSWLLSSWPSKTACVSVAHLACSCLARALPTCLLFGRGMSASAVLAAPAGGCCRKGCCGPAWSRPKPNPAVSAATPAAARHLGQRLPQMPKPSPTWEGQWGAPLWLGAPLASQLAAPQSWLLVGHI